MGDVASLAGLGWLLQLPLAGNPDLPPVSDAAWRAFATGLVGAMVFTGFVFCAGVYTARDVERHVRRPAHVLGAWALTLLIVLLIEFASAGGLPRLRWLGIWGFSGAAMLVGLRMLVRTGLDALRADGRMARDVVVLGAGPALPALLARLHAPKARGDWHLVGIFGDDMVAPDTAGRGAMLAAMRELRPHTIIVALPWSEHAAIAQLCTRLRDISANVLIACDIVDDLPTARPTTWCDVAALQVWATPLPPLHALLKRGEDLVIGGLLAIAVLPVMLLIALTIRLDSPGPVLLRQRRFGHGHAPIMVLKFRTMRHDLGDLSGMRATVRNDPRVTRVGRFLRASSLDELPQLFNVLIGDMSLVGPRPHPVEMRVDGAYYHDVVESYAARHRVRPGITGLAQINGARGLVDTIGKAQRRLDYDLHYVENWSLWLDLRILCATVFHGFISKDSY